MRQRAHTTDMLVNATVLLARASFSFHKSARRSGVTFPMRMTRKTLQKSAGTGASRGFLDGQMLIASPGMQDERFSRSLIYMCAHSSEGAMGIVVNQPAPHISFPDLLVQLDVIPTAEKIQLAVARRRRHRAQGRPGRNRARLRAAQRRLLHREFHAADRRGHLPHRDARHPQGDRARQRSARARSWRWATPAGRRASSRTRCSRTAGCIAAPTPN